MCTVLQIYFLITQAYKMFYPLHSLFSSEQKYILPASLTRAVRGYVKYSLRVTFGEAYIKLIILLREVHPFLFLSTVLKEQRGTPSCMKGEELNNHDKSTSRTLLEFPFFNYLTSFKMQRRSVLPLTKGNDFLHVLSVFAWGSEVCSKFQWCITSVFMASYHL